MRTGSDTARTLSLSLHLCGTMGDHFCFAPVRDHDSTLRPGRWLFWFVRHAIAEPAGCSRARDPGERTALRRTRGRDSMNVLSARPRCAAGLGRTARQASSGCKHPWLVPQPGAARRGHGLAATAAGVVVCSPRMDRSGRGASGLWTLRGRAGWTPKRTMPSNRLPACRRIFSRGPARGYRLCANIATGGCGARCRHGGFERGICHRRADGESPRWLGGGNQFCRRVSVVPEFLSS